MGSYGTTAAPRDEQPWPSVFGITGVCHQDILGDGLICQHFWQSCCVVTVLPGSPSAHGMVKMVPRRPLAIVPIHIDLTLRLWGKDTTVNVSLGKDRV